jgi:hypothetical protein
VATALAFGRVFTGRQATLELVAAALASVAIAALFERRGLLLATLASLVGLARSARSGARSSSSASRRGFGSPPRPRCRP